MNTMLRKTVTAFAGFAFAGGALLGGSSAASASPVTPAPSMTSVAYVASDKPSVESLTPHGVQGKQSYLVLSDEQVGNAKAIIAATKKAGMDERAAVVAIATS
jgi:hypothetical protein